MDDADMAQGNLTRAEFEEWAAAFTTNVKTRFSKLEEVTDKVSESLAAVLDFQQSILEQAEAGQGQ